MVDKVTGECPKCGKELTASFNSGLVDMFNGGFGESKPQGCPFCGTLLDIDVTVEKKYSLIVKEHAATDGE